MKITTLLFVFLFPLLTFSLSEKTNTSLYEHMVEVNENWKYQKKSRYIEFTSFSTDIDRIQKHLLLVEQSLRERRTSHLSSIQTVNRMKMLEVLHDYAMAKKFPINTEHAVRQPYFIDKFGTHCAVGFLVKESGFGWISKDISEGQNFAYVREINSPKLIQWSKDFGFSLTELAWIQPAYMPDQTYSQIGNGANGKVTNSIGNYNTWYFSGEFDTLNNLPCLQVGMYMDGQLSCLGSGIDGEINDIDYHTINGLTVAGHFLHNGTYYPMASFQNSIWTYHAIPNRPNARATAFGSITNYRSYVAIDNLTQSGTQEIWALSSNGIWSQLAKVFGSVNEISSTGTYVGVFDSSEVWINGIPTVLHSKNILIRNYTEQWETVSGLVPDTIFTLTAKQNVLYVGGTASADIGSSGVIISSILNNIAQPIMTVSTLIPSQHYSVYCIEVVYGDIYASGDFQFSSGIIGNFGRNLAKIDPSSGTYASLGFLDSTVYTFNKVNTTLFIAGDFSLNYSSSGTQMINRLAKLDGFLELEDKDISSFFKLAIHPNPSKGNLEISGISQSELQYVEIFDMQGKLVLASTQISIDANALDAGMFVVRMTSKSGQTIQKHWVKE